MPRLSFFIPCQKAIESKDDNTLTLVSVLEAITIQLAPDAPLEETDIQVGDETFRGILIPFSWSSVAHWTKEQGDMGKTFEQRIQIVLPGGEATAAGVFPFEFSQDLNFRAKTVSPALAVRGEGLHHFRISFRESGKENQEWQAVIDYPFEVHFTTDTA